MSRRTARTIRFFSLEVSQNLVLLNIRKVEFHDFWNYWKATSSQNGLKTFLFAPVFGNTIFLKARVSGSQIKPTIFRKLTSRKMDFPKVDKTFFSFVKIDTFCMPFYGFVSSPPPPPPHPTPSQFRFPPLQGTRNIYGVGGGGEQIDDFQISGFSILYFVIFRKISGFYLGNRDPHFDFVFVFEMVHGICKYQK